MYLQMSKPEDHSECTSEAVNTRLFLALETLSGKKHKSLQNRGNIFKQTQSSSNVDVSFSI